MNFEKRFCTFCRTIYSEKFIPLHRPVFNGSEKKYLNDCIDTNFVSSVGKKVDEFEDSIIKFTGAKYAIATMNGTAALQIAMELAGVCHDEEVLTQPLTFIATCNAINYSGAKPIFIDVDQDSLGMSPEALERFLQKNAFLKKGQVFNRKTKKRISACVPMHTFGFPLRVKEIQGICDKWNIPLIEDSAESLGSLYRNKHTGTYGLFGVFSFNGNKVITTGGGGMLITNNKSLAKKAKHITTTAKKNHPFEYVHDSVGYNYRLPNINAALGCAQMEQLKKFLKQKKDVSIKWKNFFYDNDVSFIQPIERAEPNYWLNTIVLNSKKERDRFLNYTNNNNVMTRPAWRLMNKLKMFNNCQSDDLKNANWLEQRIVNIPSSVP